MYLIMGAAGSGKGSQSELLKSECGFEPVAMGDLLRNVKDPEVKAFLQSGALVTDEIVYKILTDHLNEVGFKSKVLLDGFPRNIKQATWLSTQAQEHDTTIEGIIHLNLDLESAKKRLLKRARPDDIESAIESRHRDYEQKVKEVLEYFKKKEVSVYEIDGSGTVEEVHNEIMQAIGCTQK